MNEPAPFCYLSRTNLLPGKGPPDISSVPPVRKFRIAVYFNNVGMNVCTVNTKSGLFT